MNRPNILFITSDHHNTKYVGYKGHQVKTKCLDELAATGVSFDNAICPSPVCGPSRSAYMIGKYVHKTGVFGNAMPNNPQEDTWAKLGNRAGYHTCHIGKIDWTGTSPGFLENHHSVERPYMVFPYQGPGKYYVQGARFKGFRRRETPLLIKNAGYFDDIISPNKYRENFSSDLYGVYYEDKWTTEKTIEFIEKQGTNRDKPWILHCGLHLPHWQYRIPKSYFDLYDGKIELPFDFNMDNKNLPAVMKEMQIHQNLGSSTMDQLIKTITTFHGMITALDDMIGEIIESLKKTGEYENTVIFYTTDHGDSMGEHGLFFKLNPYQGSVGVPLIINGPNIPRGVNIKNPVDLVDIYPTIANLIGARPHSERPGRNLLTLPNINQDDRVALSEYHQQGTPTGWFLLMDKQYKYVYCEPEEPILFDMINDPQEMNDLSSNPSYKDKLDFFRKKLFEICDPKEIDFRCKEMMGYISENGEDETKIKSYQDYLLENNKSL